MLLPREFVEGFFNEPIVTRKPVRGMSIMKTDIVEKDKSFEMDVNLPGYSKENVKLSTKDGYLTISAETSKETEEKDQEGQVIRHERYHGSGSRSFYLGEDVDEEGITARFENGVLHISLPKKEPVSLPEEKLISID